jgi:hypothetical protein
LRAAASKRERVSRLRRAPRDSRSAVAGSERVAAGDFALRRDEEVGIGHSMR